MKPSYRIRQLAAEDLERIWLYSFQQWGAEQADHYLRALFDRFAWLAEHPKLGKARDDIKPGYFCFPEGRHLIFYIATDTGIEIIGVPHQSMDVINHVG
ncbi:type II toxin-antitoxin system RelE/ParE family toxin [Methylomonas sp. SURF-1]|uniref:Toxin n=1 Tax=Methylomonas aurea TaxID=2952224 RepID=A0ABT1UG48_9GAMM|nr:type II toxin-antitoxin system RelE/ParE family toxin [Methylomonas sp. SURF-1]MCQ8181207.1 type II toxin-antitoxin system RelE/ParE family toxin [Methylomonas sp. SURF-1]